MSGDGAGKTEEKHIAERRSLVEKAMNGMLPVAKLIGFRIVEVGEGRAATEMTTGPQHGNLMGALHGGILCDLTDATMGLAMLRSIAPHQSITTVELKINYFRPVWNSTLRSEAYIVNKGRTTAFVECNVTDERGKLICKASSTIMIIEGEKAAGR